MVILVATTTCLLTPCWSSPCCSIVEFLTVHQPSSGSNPEGKRRAAENPHYCGWVYWFRLSFGFAFTHGKAGLGSSCGDKCPDLYLAFSTLPRHRCWSGWLQLCEGGTQGPHLAVADEVRSGTALVLWCSAAGDRVLPCLCLLCKSRGFIEVGLPRP